MIVEDGWYYSFTAYAYKLLYVLCGGSTFGIAFFLAAVCTATVYLPEQYRILPDQYQPAGQKSRAKRQNPFQRNPTKQI